MEDASRALIVVTAVTVGFGLAPCLGWLNWAGVPLAFATSVVGVAGLITDRDADGQARHVDLHLAAVLVGVFGGALASLRLLLGGGCF